MAKGKKRDDQGRFTKDEASESEEIKFFDPYVGAEDDDLSDMKYVQDADTVVENTHPPETKEEAEQRAEMKKTQEEAREDEPEVSDDDVQAEKEDEAEAEAEEEPEVVAEEEEPEGDEPKIPKSRLDEVLEQKKKEKERADKLQQQLEALIDEKKKPKEPEPEPFDYVSKEKEAYDAFLEGDTEKYSAIQEEIRAAQRDELRREAERIAAEGDKTVRDNLTFEETGERIEAEYPQLVKGGEQFNEDAYSDLMDLYVGYVNTGRYSRADALQMAADKAVKIHQLGKAEKALAEEADDKDNVVNFKKKKPDVAKKKQLADNQPPVKQSGLSREDEPTLDVNSMSDEEFNALPESAKRRLRGDVL